MSSTTISLNLPSHRRWVTWKAPGEQINDNNQTWSDKDKRAQKQKLCCRPGMSVPVATSMIYLCYSQHKSSSLKNSHSSLFCFQTHKAVWLVDKSEVTTPKRLVGSMANGFIYWPSRSHKSSFPRGWQVFSSFFKQGPVWHAAPLNRIISMREDMVR